MMHSIKILLATGICAVAPLFSQAAVLAHWGFDSYTGGDDTADVLNYATGGSFTASGTTPTAVAGTTVGFNATYDPATSAASFGGNGQFTLTLTVASTVQSLTLTDLGYVASDGGKSGTVAWSYTKNSGTSVPIGSDTIPVANLPWTVFSHSPGISLTGGDVVTFTALINGDFNPGNRIQFDNIDLVYSSLVEVPEPVHYALAAFGLVFVGVRAGRRFLVHRRQA
jgi:hypothetical protein